MCVVHVGLCIKIILSDPDEAESSAEMFTLELDGHSTAQDTREAALLDILQSVHSEDAVRFFCFVFSLPGSG